MDERAAVDSSPPCLCHVGTTLKAKQKESAGGANKSTKASIVARVGQLLAITLVNPNNT